MLDRESNGRTRREGATRGDQMFGLVEPRAVVNWTSFRSRISRPMADETTADSVLGPAPKPAGSKSESRRTLDQADWSAMRCPDKRRPTPGLPRLEST